jgi:hypothetical protein
MARYGIPPTPPSTTIGTRLRHLGKIALTGFLQVLLVSINVVQISQHHYAGAGIVGFLISLMWTYNVRSVAIGGRLDKLVYSAAAMLGTVAGMTVPQFFY